MTKKTKSKLLRIAGSLTIFFYSCWSSPGVVFFDIKKQAIVSCTGEPIKKIRIELAHNYITFEGKNKNASVIYLNKINPAFNIIMDNNDTLNSNYIFKLSPNFTYTATSDNGYDRGPFRLTFIVNSLGKVINASKERCN